MNEQQQNPSTNGVHIQPASDAIMAIRLNMLILNMGEILLECWARS
jgi:hypothetical protein